MKLCKKCGEMKEESCFHKDKYAKDGIGLYKKKRKSACERCGRQRI